MKSKIWAGMLLCLVLMMGLGVTAQAQPALAFENGQILASQMENMAKDGAAAVKPVRISPGMRAATWMLWGRTSLARANTRALRAAFAAE